MKKHLRFIINKKMSKQVKEYLKNEIVKYFKIKQDIEKRKIIHAYLEKKEYEKKRKLN